MKNEQISWKRQRQAGKQADKYWIQITYILLKQKEKNILNKLFTENIFAQYYYKKLMFSKKCVFWGRVQNILL